MNKFLTFCIVVAVIIFSSGCIDQNKAGNEQEDGSDINQRPDDHDRIPELIIKQSDIPDFKLSSYEYLAYSKSSSFVDFPRNVVYPMMGYNLTTYDSALPIGTKHVGEASIWNDDSGRSVAVNVFKFDSTSEFKNYFANNRNNVNCKSIGNPKIGDNSQYCIWGNEYTPDTLDVRLEFTHNNYFVYVAVTNEKDKSLNEAIRIANIVKSRLK